MRQYTDKDALVAEIERCINKCNDKKKSCPVNTQVEAICDNRINAFKEVISLINTLEVKEVDLEKSAERYSRTIFDFNKTLRGGRVKPIDTYRWLQEKKQRDEAEFEREHGFRMNMDYLYIYPEVFGPMPDTFEEWKKINFKQGRDSK